MSALPFALVPPECDLRNFGFIPLEFRRLFTSETWLLGKPEEKLAALALWCESWHQVPTASLPDNDRVLAHLSQAGTRWPKVRDHALRGWVLCSDGRLYHPVVAEKAIEAWKAKLEQKARTHAARVAAIRKKIEKAATDEERGLLQGQLQALLADVTASKGSDREGTEEGKGEEKTRPPRFALPDWVPPEPWAGWLEMRSRKKTPNTERALKVAVSKLDELRQAGQNLAAVIDEATTRGWTSFWPQKGNSSQQSADAQLATRREAEAELFGKDRRAA